jgi:hypothetical protein
VIGSWLTDLIALTPNPSSLVGLIRFPGRKIKLGHLYCFLRHLQETTVIFPAQIAKLAGADFSLITRNQPYSSLGRGEPIHFPSSLSPRERARVRAFQDRE